MNRGMKLLVAALLCAVVTLATALSVTVARARQVGPYGPPEATVQIEVDPAAANYTLPTLTPEQRQVATNLALQDPRVRKLSQGRAADGLDLQAQVREIGVWHKSSGELIGAVLLLGFERTVTLEGEWLGLAYDCSEEANLIGRIPYARYPYQAKFVNVKELAISVDIQRLQVAGIVAGPGARQEGTRAYAPGVPRATANSCPH